jgi:hypothetical protein
MHRRALMGRGSTSDSCGARKRKSSGCSSVAVPVVAQRLDVAVEETATYLFAAQRLLYPLLAGAELVAPARGIPPSGAASPLQRRRFAHRFRIGHHGTLQTPSSRNGPQRETHENSVPVGT